MVGGIHEETHSHGIHPFFMKPGEESIDLLTILCQVMGTCIFIFRKEGDVAPDISLGRHA